MVGGDCVGVMNGDGCFLDVVVGDLDGEVLYEVFELFGDYVVWWCDDIGNGFWFVYVFGF